MNINKLKEIRDYMASGEWKKRGGFDMRVFWNVPSLSFDGSSNRPCGCFLGHPWKEGIIVGVYCQGGCGDGETGFLDEESIKAELSIDQVILEFLFDKDWFDYDNTPEGAIGRLDAVIGGYFQ